MDESGELLRKAYRNGKAAAPVQAVLASAMAWMDRNRSPKPSSSLSDSKKLLANLKESQRTQPVVRSRPARRTREITSQYTRIGCKNENISSIVSKGRNWNGSSRTASMRSFPNDSKLCLFRRARCAYFRSRQKLHRAGPKARADNPQKFSLLEYRRSERGTDIDPFPTGA